MYKWCPIIYYILQLLKFTHSFNLRLILLINNRKYVLLYEYGNECHCDIYDLTHMTAVGRKRLRRMMRTKLRKRSPCWISCKRADKINRLISFKIIFIKQTHIPGNWLFVKTKRTFRRRMNVHVFLYKIPLRRRYYVIFMRWRISRD